MSSNYSRMSREIQGLEKEREMLGGLRVVRGPAGFRIVKDLSNKGNDSYLGVDPDAMRENFRKPDNRVAAGKVVKRDYDPIYRKQPYSESYNRMMSDMYNKNPILEPQSSIYQQKRQNKRLYGSDPINNPIHDSNRIYGQHGGSIGSRTRPTSNNARDPILEGDIVLEKRFRRAVPSYFEKLESKLHQPRPFSRRQKKDVDPDSAGMCSQKLGRRMNAWMSHFDSHHFEDLKPMKNRQNHIHPKDGKEKEFRSSRSPVAAEHTKTSRTTRHPILQHEPEHFPQQKSYTKTFDKHLERSNPDAYQWRFSRKMVEGRTTAHSSIPQVVHGKGVPHTHQPPRLCRKTDPRSHTHASRKDIYEHHYSEGLSHDDTHKHRVIHVHIYM